MVKRNKTKERAQKRSLSVNKRQQQIDTRTEEEMGKDEAAAN